MDAQWFKARQKAVGLTSFDLGEAINRNRTVISKFINGLQKPTLEQAQVLAQALQVPLSVMLEKAGMAGPSVAQAASPGFAESDAVPWIPQGFEDRQPKTIGEALGVRAGVDVWRVKGVSMAGAGYMPGDFIVVDTHQADHVKPGDIVVAQVYARNGTAKTVLRRWLPPVLVSVGGAGDGTEVQVVDHDNVVIRGKVSASWRQL